MKSSFIKAACLAVTVAWLCGCGGSPSSIFKNATFQAFPQNGDLYLQLETDVSSQNVVFTGVTIPFSSNGKIIGDVAVSSNLSTGTSAMVVQLDLSSVIHMPSLTYSGNLPNGLAWPLTGVDLTKMMAFNVGGDGSKVYLYYDAATKKALLGTALTVSKLSTGTPVLLFAPFSSNGINGDVGLYTGPKPNTSGVAFIADVSSKLPSWPTLTPALTTNVASRKVQRVTPSKVQFMAVSPDQTNRDKIDWELYKMNEHHERITLH